MRTVDLFDNYLEGKLNAQELAAFELRLSSDPVFEKAFEEHKTLVSVLNASNERQVLKNKLNYNLNVLLIIQIKFLFLI